MEEVGITPLVEATGIAMRASFPASIVAASRSGLRLEGAGRTCLGLIFAVAVLLIMGTITFAMGLEVEGSVVAMAETGVHVLVAEMAAAILLIEAPMSAVVLEIFINSFTESMEVVVHSIST